jgi:hypothetical protein
MLIVSPSVGRGRREDGRVGLVGGADRDPAPPGVSDVVADLDAGVSRQNARKASGSSWETKVW